MENQNKPKRISVRKIRNIVGLKEINPLRSKTTIEPKFNGYQYKVTARINLFGKIVNILLFPVNVIVNGIIFTWYRIVDDWETGDPRSFFFCLTDPEFETVKKLYEEEEES